MFPLLLAIFLGILLGVVSGLIPGIHSNTIASVASSLASSGIATEPIIISIFIISVLAAHNAFEFVPAIFFGIPDENSLVLPLPGQRLALEGRGLEALRICAFSLLLSTIISAILSPLALAAMPVMYGAIKPVLAPAIILGLLFLLATHARAARLEAQAFGGWLSTKSAAFSLALFDFRIFFLCAAALIISGFFGFVALNFASMPDPLFAMFAGLFAPGWLFFSNSNIKPGKAHNEGGLVQPGLLKYVLIGVMLGFFADLFPGLSSPAMIAGFAIPFLALVEAEGFLALIGSIVGSHTVFAFASAAAIGKGRIGALEVARGIVFNDPSAIPVLAAAYVAALCISIVVLVKLSGKIANLAGNEALEKKGTKLAIISILAISIAIINGLPGIAVFLVAMLVGCLPFAFGVSRVWLMGSLLVPTLAYLLRLA
ncbi:hypothetical protein FJZ26_00660 [Candidatus Parvarchaeota archaeon]|nr:hypothetical protein [Candidatus Parvarchaeota archaeon]